MRIIDGIRCTGVDMDLIKECGAFLLIGRGYRYRETWLVAEVVKASEDILIESLPCSQLNGKQGLLMGVTVKRY